MRKFAFTGAVVLAAAFATSVFAGDKGKGALDGQSFDVETVAKGEKPEADEFRFKDGVFNPVQCAKWGFSPTPYTSKSEKDAVRFEADHKNAKGERMKWSGTVKGDVIEGTMQFFDPTGKPYDYTFKGKKKKA
jgi:hypothetical protein